MGFFLANFQDEVGRDIYACPSPFSHGEKKAGARDVAAILPAEKKKQFCNNLLQDNKKVKCLPLSDFQGPRD